MDLRANRWRRLAELAADEAAGWTFLHRGRRVAVWGKGAAIYDLDQGWRIPVRSPAYEVGVVQAVPNDADSFVMGVESGPTRDLMRCRLKG